MKSKILRLVLGGAPIKILQRVFVSVFLCILLCPIRAVADCPDKTGDNPFIVTKIADVPPDQHWWLLVTGPWGRRSDPVNLNSLALNVPCQFYGADNCSLCGSPYAGWKVYLWKGSVLTPPFRPKLEFCLPEKTIVNLTVSSDSRNVTITIPFKFPGTHKECYVINDSNLRDIDLGSGRQADIDVWRFEGTAGDTVIVKLEADTQGGNNGGRATLRLTGGGINRESTGTLPLTIRADIPATGTYDVSVEQSGENPFRGEYDLSVGSQRGLITAVVATDSVEP